MSNRNSQKMSAKMSQKINFSQESIQFQNDSNITELQTPDLKLYLNSDHDINSNLNLLNNSSIRNSSKRRRSNMTDRYNLTSN